MPSAKKRKVQDVVDDEELANTLDVFSPAPQTMAEQALVDSVEEAGDGTTPAPETPSKRGRGRPKGARNKRTPTPDGDIPPEERYFFQTRVGPANQQPTSTNSFSVLGLLSHDEYLAEVGKHKDPHDLEKRYLLKLHARAFPQWQFELSQSFSICLYGWGSKRQLVQNFAEHLCRQAAKRDEAHPKIVVINGYAHKLNIRHVLNTIATAIQSSPDEEEPTPVKLIGQPQDILDTLLAHLDNVTQPVYLLINSLDHPSSALRSSTTQALLSRLSAHSNVHTLCTCDTPTFQLLFPSNTRDTYNFVFHDATTFASYDVETSVVDDVNELLGRKGRRVGGSQGVSFVLKSLPENARNLYRLLLSEILTILADDDADAGDGMDAADEFIDPSLLDVSATPRKRNTTRTHAAEDIGIEYRTLYQKASEEFICSSDMNFRFLLKEFHDHQMLTTRKDVGGTELLGVPLGREEMESVLEELVI
ncbi:Origin recognition complex subunit 2 [Exophiala xenobiotica]|uniref:Origin recognition complex subunit 2 n=1 Tax=Lithohypha guttulata TaxID=1690604 RepID=A0ABR0K7U1_9EURO|nr:Origin recognition complex subunit 2 [Lithohypha guttulata]KAK5316274.1 Origin recognition complex subunit 2 [Exophiala xenobiotica]